MLHIILTILKIIGIILAALLGIILVVLVLVLFVPIGYSAEADNRNDILVKANAWWLFHALHISFLMEGMPSEEDGRRPVIKVRIMGIPIVDTSRKKEEKEQEEKAAAPKQEEAAIKPELTTQEVLHKAEPEKKEEELEKISNSKTEQAVLEKKTPEQTKVKEAKKEKKEQPVSKQKTTKKTEKKSKVQKAEKKKFRLSAVFEKIKGIKDNLKAKIANIRQAINNLLGKVDLVKAFLKNEENKQGIRNIFSSIKSILKHLLPKKIKGQILLGMADPCTTGQVLGVLGMFYPYYGKSVFIEPDFSRQVLEGNLYIKGYIQIFTLCVIGIKLIINANFRKLIRNFIKLKEEL